MFRLLFISALLFFLGYGILSFFMKHFGGKQNQRSNQQRRSSRQETQPTQNDKKFTKDIGEYVSYEEIKDDEK